MGERRELDGIFVLGPAAIVDRTLLFDAAVVEIEVNLISRRQIAGNREFPIVGTARWIGHGVGARRVLCVVSVGAQVLIERELELFVPRREDPVAGQAGFLAFRRPVLIQGRSPVLLAL